MAAIEPLTTVLSLLNESFTLAQTISALHSAPEEIKRAVDLLRTSQAQIERAKTLRNRVFNVQDPDVATDDLFKQIQTAIRNADATVTASSHTLYGSKKKDKNEVGGIKTRFGWVTGGQKVFDGNLQELQLHYGTLLYYMGVLERRLEGMGVVVQLSETFEGLEDGRSGNGLLSPPPGDGISLLVGARRSREFLLGEENDEGHDSGIGSFTSGSGDEGDGEGDFRFNIDKTLVESEDDERVEDLFLARLGNRQFQT
ncbi:hypothetical protein QBC38DRAFT_372097 [Podospora fimiseda]|uniref:Uncharacterized protein n=1 Tax=Podospora fimiseda TaxID=252190 RepID=A0AAN7GPI8_9PEZI|nr:hypothetical protein QBC38DRAFT_372097 [Podospora fimiseda]